MARLLLTLEGQRAQCKAGHGFIATGHGIKLFRYGAWCHQTQYQFISIWCHVPPDQEAQGSKLWVHQVV